MLSQMFLLILQTITRVQQSIRTLQAKSIHSLTMLTTSSTTSRLDCQLMLTISCLQFLTVMYITLRAYSLSSTKTTSQVRQKTVRFHALSSTQTHFSMQTLTTIRTHTTTWLSPHQKLALDQKIHARTLSCRVCHLKSSYILLFRDRLTHSTECSADTLVSTHL